MNIFIHGEKVHDFSTFSPKLSPFRHCGKPTKGAHASITVDMSIFLASSNSFLIQNTHLTIVNNILLFENCQTH